MSARWNSSQMGQKPASVPRKPPERHTGTEKPAAALLSQETQHPPYVAAQHYIGPCQLTIANGTHYPGRMRAVLVGPTDEALLLAVLAALKTYYASCQKPDL
jgi:hypothetical protein